MENYILNCYTKWLKDKQGNILKRISKLTIVAIILIVLLFFTLGFAVFFLFTNNECVLYVAAFEVVLGVVSYIYTDKYEIKHSFNDFEKYKTHCTELKKMLINKTQINESFIPVIIARLQMKIDVLELKSKTNYEHVHKLMQLLVLPVILVMLEGIIGEQSVEFAMGYGFTMISMLLIVYGILFGVISLYNGAVIKRQQEKYQQLVEDLQSILDLETCSQKTECNTSA